MNIHDHGENDALDFSLGETWQVVARIAHDVMEANRIERNESDAKRGMPNVDSVEKAAS